MKIVFKPIVSFNAKGIEKWLAGRDKKAMQKLGAVMRGKVMKEIASAPAGDYAPAGKSFFSHPKIKRGKVVAPDSNVKRAIQYGIDPDQPGSVVIGPTFAQDLYLLHETGGRARLKNKRRRQLGIGKPGPVRRGGKADSGQRRFVAGPWDSGGNLNVVEPIWFAKIRTPRQLARAEAIDAAAYGPPEYSADYPARPVLKNAVARVRPELQRYIDEAYAAADGS